MTFADLLYKGFVWVGGKITRILAVTGGTIAILASSGIIPESQLKFWMAGIAVLTYWRGQSTGKTYDQARAVLASATAPVVVGPTVTMAEVAPPETPTTAVKPPLLEKLG